MNILFLSTEIPYPPDHGHHLRTLNVLKILARRNKIFFVAFARNKEELRYQEYLYELCETVDVFPIPQGWRLYASLLLNAFSAKPYTVQRYLRKEALQKIKQLIKQQKIDLVHCDMLHLGAYFEAVKQLPAVLTNHNVESLRLKRWYQVEPNFLLKCYLYLQYKKLYNFEKNICPRYRKCVVVSDTDRKILSEMCHNDNFITIPNGVDSDYFSPDDSFSPLPHSLIWTGGMNSPYNHDAVDYFLDQILPLIKQQIPDVRSFFVGKSPTDKLKEMARNDSYIEVTGYVEDVRPFMNKALIFIAPIRSGSGTKIKILNALSQAKAVVTTSIGAEGIDVLDNENIMIADDPVEFSHKVIYLLKNPETARIMGKKGRELIKKKYDWRVIELQINKIYGAISTN